MANILNKPTTFASDVLKAEHPVHNHFQDWLDGKEPTKRQARKFLNAFPRYKFIKKAEEKA